MYLNFGEERGSRPINVPPHTPSFCDHNLRITFATLSGGTPCTVFACLAETQRHLSLSHQCGTRTQGQRNDQNYGFATSFRRRRRKSSYPGSTGRISQRLICTSRLGQAIRPLLFAQQGSPRPASNTCASNNRRSATHVTYSG